MEIKHPTRRTVPRTAWSPTSGTASGSFWSRSAWPGGLLVLVSALLLRLHGLGHKPYWMDEVTTLRRSSLGLAALVRDSLSFHHLPLYFVISSWFTPFGLGTGVMRLPSALFGALSCLILFLLGRSVAGWRCGLAAGLLLAMSPFQVQYAQEARSYTLVTCFILLGVWGTVRLARAPRSDRFGWLLYGVGTTLALDTLSVALFWFAAAQICALMIARDAGRSEPAAGRRFRRIWLLVQAAILMFYLPFIAVMVHLTRGNMGSGLDWVPPPTLHSVSTTLQSVFMMRDSSLIAFRVFPGPLDLAGVPWFGIAVLALGGLGLLSARGSPAVRVLAIAFLALPVGVALVSLWSSLWMPRYLSWSGPLLFLLAGVGVARLPTRAGTLLLLLIAGIGFANLRPYYRTESKPLWNVAGRTLRDSWRPGDLVLTDDPATIGMMNVMLEPHAAVTGRPPAIGFGRSDWTTESVQAIAAFGSGRRVWVLHGRVGQNDPYKLDTLLGSVVALGQPASRQVVGLDITLLRFDPAVAAGDVHPNVP